MNDKEDGWKVVDETARKVFVTELATSLFLALMERKIEAEIVYGKAVQLNNVDGCLGDAMTFTRALESNGMAPWSEWRGPPREEVEKES